MTTLTSWKLGSTSFLHAQTPNQFPETFLLQEQHKPLSPISSHSRKPLPSCNFLAGSCHLKNDKKLQVWLACRCPCSILSLTRFSLVSRVISCCRLASMRASGGSCRFWASSCCCRLFSSFRLWISPRRDSSSFSWLFFWDCSWDSSSLRRLSNSLCEHTQKGTSPVLRGSVKL